MAEEYEVGSPEWWLLRLHGKLQERRPALKVLDSYYTGDQPLAFASDRFRQAFGKRIAHLSDNWCGVVVDAVEERLQVQGFRVPEPGGQQEVVSGPGDQQAWEIWQRNDLDAGSQMFHIDTFVNGYGNVLVWSDKDGKALITPEHASQTLVEPVPGMPRERAAAIKEWRDDWTGRIMATVYLPDGLYKFVSSNVYRDDISAGSRVKWERREVPNEAWPLPNPLGVVPMVPFMNRQRLLDTCDSELRGVMPLQDAVNKLTTDMMVASEYQAFKQRWATGLEIPIDPETNQPIEPFNSAMDRLWVSESSDTTFGEFGQVDLRVFVAGIEMFVQHIATQSRTPPHYFYLSGNFPSGESIKAAETGLVAKSRRRMTTFSDAWENVIRLAFAIEDNPKQNAFQSQTIWADPESRSEAEHTDAMVKLSSLGVPKEALWERWGFSPQEIERFLEQREREAKLIVETATGQAPGTLPPAAMPAMVGNGQQAPPEGGA